MPVALSVLAKPLPLKPALLLSTVPSTLQNPAAFSSTTSEEFTPPDVELELDELDDELELEELELVELEEVELVELELEELELLDDEEEPPTGPLQLPATTPLPIICM